MKTIATALSASLLLASSMASASSPSAEGAEVYIVSPANGATVAESFQVVFGLRSMGVAPAGVERKNTGHHHLIVNGEVPPAGMPMGANVKHFGGGQTETTLTLPKGEHTLQLVLGDHMHVPHNPPVVSEKITVTVK